MKNTTWLIALASTGLLAAMAACSSDSGTGNPGGGGTVSFGGTGNNSGSGGANTGGANTGGANTGGANTGGANTGGGGTGGGAAGSGGGGTGGTAGDGGICKTPTTLHPPNADAGTSTLYCPFSATDGGKNQYCDTASEHCCEPGSGTASCTAKATPCASTDTDWQCEDPKDCGSGQVCCGIGTMVKNTDPNCANYASGFKGTHCATSCTTGEITMCTSDGECGSGKTCLPFGAKGNQVGGCL